MSVVFNMIKIKYCYWETSNGDEQTRYSKGAAWGKGA